MKMDRNLNPDGMGKYATLNLRKLQAACAGTNSVFERWTPAVAQALATLEEAGALEYGCVGAADEFFLIKLKDVHAEAALKAYAASAREVDPEFSSEVLDMAARSGPHHPLCKAPD